MRRRLPAARLALRPRERDPDEPARVRGGRDVPGLGRATAWSSSRCPTDARRARSRPCSRGSRPRTPPSARQGLPATQRSRQVAATTGRFLFALAASQAGVEVLEIGGSRGYSSIWLAAGARVLGGALVSLEHRSGQVRGVARERRGRRARRVGRARRGRRARDARRDRRTRSTSSSSTPRRTTTSRSSRSRDRCSSRAGSSSPTTSSRTSRRSARTRRHGRPIRRSRASPCRSTAASSSRSCSVRPDATPLDRPSAGVRMLPLPRKGGGPA